MSYPRPHPLRYQHKPTREEAEALIQYACDSFSIPLPSLTNWKNRERDFVDVRQGIVLALREHQWKYEEIRSLGIYDSNSSIHAAVTKPSNTTIAIAFHLVDHLQRNILCLNPDLLEPSTPQKPELPKSRPEKKPSKPSTVSLKPFILTPPSPQTPK